MATKTKKIKSFEDACKALGIQPNLPDVSGLPEVHQKAIIAHYKLVIIAQALNEGWTPDWSDWNQWKYYAWFEVKADKERPSGFGLSYSYCANAYSYATVSSRLCFKTRELALYAAKTFIHLYQD